MKKILSVILLLCMAVGIAGCGKGAQEQIDPNAIAKVVTGESTQYVLTVEDMVGAIDPSGNTVITLLKDITSNKTLALPYSCTLDLAGHTVQTDPKRGIGISVAEAGEENPLTLLKNGTVRSYADSIRVKAGAVQLVDMQLYTTYGMCVSLYDPAEAYLELNRIQGSTLFSEAYSCLAYLGTETDYSKTGVTLENTTLVAANTDGAQVFHTSGSGTVPGLIDLGEGMKIYSYADKLAPDKMWFGGTGLAKAKTTLSLDGREYGDITLWQEDTENTVIDVLMVGNSFCWYFTEELHAVANAAGVQLNVNNLYDGGCLVQEHWEWLQSDAEKYEQYWVSNDFGRFQDTRNLKLSSALAFEDWDVITLQQHYGSGVKDVEAALAKVENADGLYAHFKSTCPDAKLYWHNTWAYQVGHERMPSTADQTLRQNNINYVSQTVADRNGVDQIPGGQAWAIARRTVGDDLCRSDLYHDGDVGGGQYLNACVWFEVLTGRSCIGNTWRPSTYKLSEEKVAGLQQAAHQAVAEMYGADYAK